MLRIYPFQIDNKETQYESVLVRMMVQEDLAAFRVFKASDYRISPFELESVLIEHAAIAEAAIVPSPDPVRLAVPKAFVVLCRGLALSAELARDIFVFLRERLAPYKRIRRLEFAELPKTISGKIRHGVQRCTEDQQVKAGLLGGATLQEDFRKLSRTSATSTAIE